MTTQGPYGIIARLYRKKVKEVFCYAKTNLSTQETPPRARAWVPQTNVGFFWPGRVKTSPQEGTSSIVGQDEQSCQKGELEELSVLRSIF